ncbi:glycosyltransferase family 1 protein [Salipiger sp. IMCC34102]|uniref:glycosyltransferase family 4 protein n=1 Tax=Salipiger sp. IMCC34102 TaxID=2510647 RepID=UPI00101B5C80|nr:glycosyltransferase family 4 protein [Salipiger sp. IMCC34102]RYH03086.1 glycosyltransferase family 1 protein [Salipiger sp. IMCC34102]
MNIRVIAPNLKRRLSGVTSTVIRLVPLQARQIEIRATGPALPAHVPQISLAALPILPRAPRRVWHARRNVEMIAGLALKHVARKNLALMFTSASQRPHTWLTRWLIARMDAVVATSEKSRAFLKVPATVIHHGIDTGVFRPAPDRAALRARLGLPQGARLIGCFGRIRASKGTDRFVEAMIRCLPDHPDAIALVMGRAVDKDRDFLADLRDRICVADLTDRIRFLPEVPVEATPDWYAALDLYVAPQRSEGFGLTPLEAAACGVPTIATDVGAFSDIIAEGKTGTLLPDGDPETIARAVDALLRDHARLARWSAACRPRVERGFRLADEAQALVALYRDLLGEDAPARARDA